MLLVGTYSLPPDPSNFGGAPSSGAQASAQLAAGSSKVRKYLRELKDGFGVSLSLKWSGKYVISLEGHKSRKTPGQHTLSLGISRKCFMRAARIAYTYGRHKG